MASKDNKNKTILYADYSERNMLAAREAIEPLGFGNFVHCDDREKTVELIGEMRPDLVLVGLYLDGMRGISTIRAIRDSGSDENPIGRTVPILLGAPKLDRRGMRDAVDAGIEGVFRQPIDPKRLRKIIETVMRSPRRFVLKENYFGPARPQDMIRAGTTMPKAPATKTPSQATTPVEETTPENPGRRKRDRIKAAMLETPPVASASPAPARRRAAVGKPAPAKSAQPVETVADIRDDKSPLVGMSDTIEVANVQARLNGSGQVFDDSDLPEVPIAHDRDTGPQNIEAVQSAREALSPIIEPASQEHETEEPDDDPIETAADDDSEELVEIDLHEALISHKLWVDTGGKEGTVMSIDHADLREAELEGIDLSRCGLPFASFKRANCKDAVLRRCNLTGADFIESNLDSANLAASRLSGARFNDAMLRNTVFLGSDLSNASFRGQHLLNCDLSGTNLAGTDFRDADLTGTRGLFAEQIQRARVNANTRLPRNLKLRD